MPSLYGKIICFSTGELASCLLGILCAIPLCGYHFAYTCRVPNIWLAGKPGHRVLELCVCRRHLCLRGCLSGAFLCFCGKLHYICSQIHFPHNFNFMKIFFKNSIWRHLVLMISNWRRHLLKVKASSDEVLRASSA